MSRYSDVFTVLGDEDKKPGGGGMDFGYGSLISSIADLGKSAYGIVREEQGKEEVRKKSERDSQAMLAKADSVILMDRRAADALASATFAEGVSAASAATKSASAAQDAQRAASARQAATAAMMAAMTAGASLTGEAADKRVAAANKYAVEKADAAVAAAESSSRSPGDAAAKARATQADAAASAASLVAAQVAGGAIAMALPAASSKRDERVDARTPKPSASGGLESFLMKKVGPLPVYGWGVAASAVTTGAVFYFRSRRHARMM